MLELVKKHASRVEKASIDEFYLDLTEYVEESLRESCTDGELEDALSKTHLFGTSFVDINGMEGRRLAVAAKFIAELRQRILEVSLEFVFFGGGKSDQNPQVN